MRSSLVLSLLLLLAALMPAQADNAALALEVYTAGDRGYGVTSTIIYGKSEALLVDAQFMEADAAIVADKIAALGRRLTTIIVTHPDTDHIVGLSLLHKRFPDARIYMSSAGLKIYREKIGKVRTQFAGSTRPQEAPPEEPLAKPLTQTNFTVDGQTIEIIPDLQGDVFEAAANSVVWVPSLKALIAGDLAFDHVHLWLDESKPEDRAAWQVALKKLAAMNATIVVAGHKANVASADTPAVIAASGEYLAAFEQERAANADAKSFAAAMRKRFPDYVHPLFLDLAAKHLYPAAAK